MMGERGGESLEEGRGEKEPRMGGGIAGLVLLIWFVWSFWLNDTILDSTR